MEATWSARVSRQGRQECSIYASPVVKGLIHCGFTLLFSTASGNQLCYLQSWAMGYLYIESHNKTDVEQAIEGIRSLARGNGICLPSVCLWFLSLHRNSCFSCSQWHCANDRQRENKCAGSTRSQCCLRHSGPSGVATSSLGSLIVSVMEHWDGVVHIQLNTDLPSQVSEVQSTFGRLEHSSRISVRTPRVHRLHWGFGAAHRRAPPGPSHVCWWHTIDGTTTFQVLLQGYRVSEWVSEGLTAH